MHQNSLRTYTGILSVVATLVTSGYAFADTAAQIRARQEVDHSVHAVVAAYATTDVDTYFSYYADDMLICCSKAEPWSKQAYYTMWKQNVVNGGGVSHAEVANLKINVSPNGTAAVAFYQMPCIRRMPTAGENPNVTYNMTETWIKRGGRWRVEGLAFSVARPASPPSAP